MFMKNGWTRFNYCNVATTGMATREIHSPHVAIQWLPQANYIFSGLGITSDLEHYRIVHGIDYWLSFSTASKVSPKGGYLFLCPPAHLGSSDGSFRPPGVAAYWSLDASGVKRLTHRKAKMLGFPDVAFKMKVWTQNWDENIYAGLRQFHRGKGFDPNSQDVARFMGLPLYESSWLDDNDVDVVPAQLHSNDNFSFNEVCECPFIKTPGKERIATRYIPDSSLAAPRLVGGYRGIMMRLITQARMLSLLGGFGLLVALFLWGFPLLRFANQETINVAVHRAEILESWLQDDALVNLIELLKKDVRAATVYNAIEGEIIRVKWVRRQLGIDNFGV
ncbi:hypothetical protein B0H12DRAFT_329554 [Mycena haematopus]|nr:hypothetical protein B0H12DRAFT_329554 [Mycena haematopus]